MCGQTVGSLQSSSAPPSLGRGRVVSPPPNSPDASKHANFIPNNVKIAIFHTGITKNRPLLKCWIFRIQTPACDLQMQIFVIESLFARDLNFHSLIHDKLADYQAVNVCTGGKFSNSK